VPRLIVGGGLGNQLYSFALAHLIAIKTNKKVKLVFVLDKYSRDDRPIELQSFMKHCKHNLQIDVDNQLGFILRILDKIESLNPAAGRNLKNLFRIVEAESLKKSIPNGALGNFLKQSPLIVRGFVLDTYLMDEIWPTINSEIQETLDQNYEEVKPKLPTEFQTCHIRRGDTLHFGDLHGILNFDYYKTNLRQGLPTVICCDDEKFIQEIKFTFPSALVFGPRDLTPIQTLAVLSKSTINVGANSTLSWWASFISKDNSGRINFLPKPWNQQPQVNEARIEIFGARYVEAMFEL
jgi:hypothetical protein